MLLLFQYPAWLEENRASLPSEEHDRYRKQYDLVCDVCSEYDAETSGDSDEVKKKRFEKLLSLMQQVHVIMAAEIVCLKELCHGLCNAIQKSLA